MDDVMGKVTRKAEVVELSSSDDDGPNPGPSEPLPSCPICLTDILDPLEKAVTGCMHTFCRACLAEWLRVKRFCPLCKRRVCTYVTHIRDDATFTEVEVPPSPVHDYPQQQNRHHHNHQQPNQYHHYHDHYHEWYRAYYQYHHLHQHQHQHHNQNGIRGGDVHSGSSGHREGPVGSQPEGLHYDQRDPWVGQEATVFSAAARYQQLTGRSEEGDLLRQLHRIADRLAETDALYDSRRLPGALLRFRRGTTAATEASGGLDRGGSEGEGERERERWRVTVIRPWSQQQQRHGTAATGTTPAREAQRQPRPYFFRLQQRLAATAAATNGGASGVDSGRRDPWDAATAAAASFMAAAAPPPPQPASSAAATAAAHANVPPQQLPSDDQAVAMVTRRRIYDLGLWAAGVRGGRGSSVRSTAASGSASCIRGGHLSAAAVAAPASRVQERRQQLDLWVGRELQALLGATDLSLLRALVIGLVDRFGVDRDWSAEVEQSTTAVQMGQTSAAAVTGGGHQAAAVAAATASRPHAVMRESRQQLMLPRRQQQEQQLPGTAPGGSGAAAAAAADDGAGPLASLRPFLLERSSHFWHELRQFMLSGLTVQAYDARVQYRYHGSGGDGNGGGGGVRVASEAPAAVTQRPRVARYPPLRRPRLAGAPLALAVPSTAGVAAPLPTRTAVSSGGVAPALLPGLTAAGRGAPLQPPRQQQQVARLQLRQPVDAEARNGASVRSVEVVDLTLLDSSSTGSGSGPADDYDVEPEVVGRWWRGPAGAAHGDGAGAAVTRTSGGGGLGSGGEGAAAAIGVLPGEQTRPSHSRWDAIIDCPEFTIEAAVPMAEAVAAGRPAKRRRRWDERPGDVVLAHAQGEASEAAPGIDGTICPDATDPVLAVHVDAVAAGEAAAAEMAGRTSVDEAIGAAAATAVGCWTGVPCLLEEDHGAVPGAPAAAAGRDVPCDGGIHGYVPLGQEGDRLREGRCTCDKDRSCTGSRQIHSGKGISRSRNRRRRSRSGGRSESRERHKWRRHRRREHERVDGRDGDGDSHGCTQAHNSHHRRYHYHPDHQHNYENCFPENDPHHHHGHSRHRQRLRHRGRCRSADDRHLARGVQSPQAEEGSINSDDRWQLELPGELLLPVWSGH